MSRPLLLCAALLTGGTPASLAFAQGTRQVIVPAQAATASQDVSSHDPEGDPPEATDTLSQAPTAPGSPKASPGAPVTPSTAATLNLPTSTSAHNAPLSGLAAKLADHGVYLRAVLINQFADNPRGGVMQGDTNVGQLNFGADVNLGTLLGIKGGSFHFTVYRDYGSGLNHDVTGTFTKQQYIYKNEYPQLHLGLFAYEQKLFHNKLDLIAGRLGTTSYYAHLVPNCLFQAGVHCGVPRLINAEAGYSLLPSATWGGNVTYHPTRHTYLETGAFEVNPYISHTNGLDFSTAHANGVTIPMEAGWADTDLKTRAYPFELKVGGYISTAPRNDPYFNTTAVQLACPAKR